MSVKGLVASFKSFAPHHTIEVCITDKEKGVFVVYRSEVDRSFSIKEDAHLVSGSTCLRSHSRLTVVRNEETSARPCCNDGAVIWPRVLQHKICSHTRIAHHQGRGSQVFHVSVQVDQGILPVFHGHPNVSQRMRTPFRDESFCEGI